MENQDGKNVNSPDIQPSPGVAVLSASTVVGPVHLRSWQPPVDKGKTFFHVLVCFCSCVAVFLCVRMCMCACLCMCMCMCKCLCMCMCMCMGDPHFTGMRKDMCTSSLGAACIGARFHRLLIKEQADLIIVQ
jgi:hypothetical protein